jgi:hypothetical protein
VFALALLFGLLRAADLGDRMIEHELDEQEVARLLYPDGNVALLERPDPDDQISQGRGG